MLTDKARAAGGVCETAKKDLAQLRPTRDMVSNGSLKDGIWGDFFYQGFRARAIETRPAGSTNCR